MYNIHCLNKIAAVGTNRFNENYKLTDNINDADAVLVRSAAMHDIDLSEKTIAIARAGAGVNNIPIDKCTENGIVVFNTPGANANAVKELVIAALLLTSRKIVQSTQWIKTLKGSGDQVSKLVEKGKSQFVGPEIQGKTLGVIGLGAIGILVANAAHKLGMTVYGYDPYLSVDAAWGLSSSTKHAHTLDEIFSCDYITIHVPLTPDTKYLINKESLEKMNDGVRILNFARGDLVNTQDVIDAVHSGKVASYATDFPADEMIGEENIIAIPHLGASTPESEDNCARMAVDQLIDYIENGNIKNSVNLPAISMPKEGDARFCIIHKNVPNTISLLGGVMGKANINIENMQSKSKKDHAYTIVDVTGGNIDEAVEDLKKIPVVIRVRVL